MEDQQEKMRDLKKEPMVALDVDPDTGEFSILTGDKLLRVRYTRWSDNDYDEQFWDERCSA